MSQKLGYWARTQSGMDAVAVKAFAEALEVIPYTLAENAGLNPIEIVTELPTSRRCAATCVARRPASTCARVRFPT